MRLVQRWWSVIFVAPMVVVLSGCGTQAPPPTRLALATFQPATTVVGQPDFVSNTPTTTQSGIGDLYGDAGLVDGVFYAPDYGNNRVLGYLNGIPSSNGASADFVLGQPDFTSSTGGSAADGLAGPESVFGAAGKLFVTDYKNNRVLIWNTRPKTTQVAANVVVGQSAFGMSASTCTASGMQDPESGTATSGKLIVADSHNNRVLIYNSIPTTNGAPADIVLGQNSFTTCAADDDNQDGVADTAPTARTLNYPTGVWTDGTRLIVADVSNNRVLIWNSFPTHNFQPADVVIGQPDMVTATSAAGASGMYHPYFLTSNGLQLFVADVLNERVLVFDTIPTSNGASANEVLGQSDFTHVTENDDNQDGSPDATPTARTMYDPEGMLVTSNALVVTDGSNDRYLVFRP